MQTTLRLDDDLGRRAKTQAAAQGISLTRLVEEAIREHLDRPAPARRRRPLHLPVSSAAGGLAPGFASLEEAVAAADLATDQALARRRLITRDGGFSRFPGLDRWSPAEEV
ncbi:MAG TPA: hypothetical protein DD490_16115 [Acidobacteria bacterium]|nr:hypothetical protein [Acidobacteriota bacterium]